MCHVWNFGDHRELPDRGLFCQMIHAGADPSNPEIHLANPTPYV